MKIQNEKFWDEKNNILLLRGSVELFTHENWYD